ncbi:hypothetical protein [Rhizobium sp. Leaf306]|uniref:hypothetical protein n=1 Tax=Rhizobium sp. Leaf306 TaxID=1736330 RepID=UPI0012E700A6|nr:hypothetical protein [Rhizobium sp. Leaf306]
MESLDLKALASIGNTALGELRNELIMNRGDLSRVSPSLVRKLEVAANDYSAMRTQLTLLDAEFGMYLELYDLLTEQMSSSDTAYSTAVGKVTTTLSDVFEP